MIMKVISFFLSGPVIQVVTSFDRKILVQFLGLSIWDTINFACPTIGTFRDIFPL